MQEFYCTKPAKQPVKRISIDDILNGEIENLYLYSPKGNWTTTRTDLRHTWTGLYMYRASRLKIFNEKYKNLIESDLSTHYRSFKIPKAHGGFRKIDDPDAELRKAQNELKELLEYYGVSYHTAAFAYIKGRCPKDAVMKHKLNNSNWCLRTDFSNFFGSITPEFLLKMLTMQYPFCFWTDDEKETLKMSLSICFLHGGLPQGTVISPMLTNAMMIPIDYTIFKELVSKKKFVYTRYADDIQISSYTKFDKDRMVSYIDKVLEDFGAPFRIKPEKTKFSSVAGINYMLGLNLNKDHNITVGHAKKKIFKAMVNNFFADWINGVVWNKDDVNYMCGIYSYYRSIEQEYTDYMVRKLEEKYKVPFREITKRILHG